MICPIPRFFERFPADQLPGRLVNMGRGEVDGISALSDPGPHRGDRGVGVPSREQVPVHLLDAPERPIHQQFDEDILHDGIHGLFSPSRSLEVDRRLDAAGLLRTRASEPRRPAGTGRAFRLQLLLWVRVGEDINGRVKTGHLWTPQNRPFPAARDC